MLSFSFYNHVKPAFYPTQRVIVEGRTEYQVLSVRASDHSGFIYDLGGPEGRWSGVPESELLNATQQMGLFGNATI